jgi:alpha-tubulin suppressor-like RCC1 family protein
VILFRSVAVSQFSTFVLTSCGKVFSFGSNVDNILGHSFDKLSVPRPKIVKFSCGTAPKITAISCGRKNAVFVGADGTLWGVGYGISAGSTEGAVFLTVFFGLPVKKVVCGLMNYLVFYINWIKRR